MAYLPVCTRFHSAFYNQISVCRETFILYSRDIFRKIVKNSTEKVVSFGIAYGKSSIFTVLTKEKHEKFNDFLTFTILNIRQRRIIYEYVGDMVEEA